MVRWGYSQSGLQRRRCRECGKTFNAAHGTALAHTHKRDALLAFTKQMLMPNPMSCREAAEHFDVHRMTAWRWRQKVLKAIEDVGSEELGWQDADCVGASKAAQACRNSLLDGIMNGDREIGWKF